MFSPSCDLCAQVDSAMAIPLENAFNGENAEYRIRFYNFPSFIFSHYKLLISFLLSYYSFLYSMLVPFHQ